MQIYRFVKISALSMPRTWVAKISTLSMLRFNVQLKLSLLDIVAQ